MLGERAWPSLDSRLALGELARGDRRPAVLAVEPMTLEAGAP
jgi:hypothetical protein